MFGGGDLVGVGACATATREGVGVVSVRPKVGVFRCRVGYAVLRSVKSPPRLSLYGRLLKSTAPPAAEPIIRNAIMQYKNFLILPPTLRIFPPKNRLVRTKEQRFLHLPLLTVLLQPYAFSTETPRLMLRNNTFSPHSQR